MSEPVTSVPVPAAMPSEPLVDQIAAFLLLRDEMVTDPDERTDDERAESAQAILDLFAPILAEKERLDHECQASMRPIADLRSDLDAAEAALAGERERTVRDTLLHVRNLLAANQVPLGKDFEDVWNTNARELYES